MYSSTDPSLSLALCPAVPDWFCIVLFQHFILLHSNFTCFWLLVDWKAQGQKPYLVYLLPFSWNMVSFVHIVGIQRNTAKQIISHYFSYNHDLWNSYYVKVKPEILPFHSLLAEDKEDVIYFGNTFFTSASLRKMSSPFKFTLQSTKSSLSLPPALLPLPVLLNYKVRAVVLVEWGFLLRFLCS